MRVRALSLVLPLLIMVACSSGSTGPTSSAALLGTPAASGSAAPDTVVADQVPADQLPTASGGFGDKPTLTFPAGDPPGACNGLSSSTEPARPPRRETG